MISFGIDVCMYFHSFVIQFNSNMSWRPPPPISISRNIYEIWRKNLLATDGLTDKVRYRGATLLKSPIFTKNTSFGMDVCIFILLIFNSIFIKPTIIIMIVILHLQLFQQIIKLRLITAFEVGYEFPREVMSLNLPRKAIFHNGNIYRRYTSTSILLQTSNNDVIWNFYDYI